jgi:hypothetical protein
MSKKHFFKLFLSTAIISSPTYAQEVDWRKYTAAEESLEFSTSPSKTNYKADSFVDILKEPMNEVGPLRSYVEEFNLHNDKEISSPRQGVAISELPNPEIPPENLE